MSIPNTQTLFEKYPKGAESGKQFARTVDLLLINEARTEGNSATIFDDSSGDYYGLDSLTLGFRQVGTIGYQYKFFGSPLNNEHKANIEASIKAIASNQDFLGLTKLCIVTPEDLLQQGRSKIGDLEWFELLKPQLPFELEHIGHTKILEMMLRAPHVAIFDYPELLPQGFARQKSLVETKDAVVSHLLTEFQMIDFVGMSVYKEDTGRGIPVEDIYIPLDLISLESQSESRLDPLKTVTKPGKYVILGDPGSGKSTLAKFLSISGYSNTLQLKYGASADERLPIVVVLRRYAEELDRQFDLSPLDYIAQTLSADLSLPSVDLNFLIAHLETRRAIILFDGLDELSNPQLKKLVRDRIVNLTTSYPGNTYIVTSRIVGYEGPFRLPTDSFTHFKVADLTLTQMEQFVQDWHRARIAAPIEREQSAKDLIRLLRDQDHGAIRELGKNPLLLTIIALVHKIDAVLPDERVVLYQKCTETLLNTWHNWKFKAQLPTSRGQVEKRNRHRLEAVAAWMHERGTTKGSRAIVNESDLIEFLVEYISSRESSSRNVEDPEDAAQTFLKFVRDRAGLLIEVGAERYSFLHLTFQEYLTASQIKTSSERYGIESTWSHIEAHLKDSKWHEVIRLLVGEMKEEQNQEDFVRRIIAMNDECSDPALVVLLAGLLMDAIPAADIEAERILSALFVATSRAENHDLIESLLAATRRVAEKDPFYRDALRERALLDVNRGIFGSTESLVAAALDVLPTDRTRLGVPLFGDDRSEQAFRRLFTPYEASAGASGYSQTDVARLRTLFLADSFDSPTTNTTAVEMLGVYWHINPNDATQIAFDVLLLVALEGHGGPYNDFVPKLFSLYVSDTSNAFPIREAIALDPLTADGKMAGILSQRNSHRVRAMSLSQRTDEKKAIMDEATVMAAAAIRKTSRNDIRRSALLVSPELRISEINVPDATFSGYAPDVERFLPDHYSLQAKNIAIYVETMQLQPGTHWPFAIASFANKVRPTKWLAVASDQQSDDILAIQLLLSSCFKASHRFELFPQDVCDQLERRSEKSKSLRLKVARLVTRHLEGGTKNLGRKTDFISWFNAATGEY